MRNINEYKRRFNTLLESTMGNVKPLINEEETTTYCQKTYPMYKGDTLTNREEQKKCKTLTSSYLSKFSNNSETGCGGYQYFGHADGTFYISGMFIVNIGGVLNKANNTLATKGILDKIESLCSIKILRENLSNVNSGLSKASKIKPDIVKRITDYNYEVTLPSTDKTDTSIKNATFKFAWVYGKKADKTVDGYFYDNGESGTINANLSSLYADRLWKGDYYVDACPF